MPAKQQIRAGFLCNLQIDLGNPAAASKRSNAERESEIVNLKQEASFGRRRSRMEPEVKFNILSLLFFTHCASSREAVHISV